MMVFQRRQSGELVSSPSSVHIHFSPLRERCFPQPQAMLCVIDF